MANEIVIFKGPNLNQATEAVAVILSSYMTSPLRNVDDDLQDNFILNVAKLFTGYSLDVIEQATAEMPLRIPGYKFELYDIREYLDGIVREQARQRYLENYRKSTPKTPEEIAFDAQCAQERAEYHLWLETHPDGTYREYLGIQPKVTEPD